MEDSEAYKITSFEEAVKKFETKEITVEQLGRIAHINGKELKFWNPETDPNPQYPDGNENSRVGFKWNPYTNVKGKYYQHVIKTVALKLIDILHEHTLKKYDKNQFVYSDPRLIELDKFTKTYVANNFNDSHDYKEVFMNKLVDIVNGTVAKEDIYYRTVYFDFINQLIKHFPNGIPLTPQETANLLRHHKGIK